MNAAAVIETHESSVEVEDADDQLPSAILDSGNAVFEHLYAEFDPETRSVSFGEDHPSVNGVPFAVHHNRVVRFYAPQGADAEQVGDVLRSDEIQAKLARLADAYSCDWDGHNHVGDFGDEQELIQEIRDEIDQFEPTWSACRFDEWCAPAQAATVQELGGDAEKIPALVKKIEEQARVEQNVILVGDGGEVLRRWLEESLDDE